MAETSIDALRRSYGIVDEDRTSLTAEDTATVDATYGSEEAGVINNLRTRLGEVEQVLKDNGLLK